MKAKYQIRFLSIIVTIVIPLVLLSSNSNLDKYFVENELANFPLTNTIEMNGYTDIESYFDNPIWINDNIIGSIISSPTISDLDNDSDMEIILLTDRNFVYILDHTGLPLDGWGEPFALHLDEDLTSHSGDAPHPIVLDFNDDGEQEIIVATFNGTIHAFFLNGTEVPGWPVYIDGNISSSPAAGDIDGDLQDEIVVSSWNFNIHAFELDGNNVTGFPFTGSTDQIFSTPALANLDSDPELEIAFGSDDSNVYVLNGDGTVMPGWPKETKHHVKSAPAIADLDLDGKNEIIVGSVDKSIYIFRNNGSNFGSWPCKTPISIYTSPTVGDINCDGFIDIVIQANSSLYAFTDVVNSNDTEWTNYYPGVISREQIIVDIDGDLVPEIIQVTSIGFIRIISNNGTTIHSKLLTFNGIESQPAVGDIDGDKILEIIFTTRATGTVEAIAEVHAFKLGSLGLLPWGGFRAGRERNGRPFDSDGDGLNTAEEEILGTDENNPDTDGDTILDGDEIYKYNLNPVIPDADADYDNDLLSNVDEFDIYNTDPTNPDTDGDTLEDGEEVYTYGTDPTKSDTDDDFMPDNFEVRFENTDPHVPDTYQDLDEDNLTNVEEYDQDTNPDNPDTDGDSLLDGDEVKRYHTDPNVPDADLDSDGDGLTNVDEVDLYGTDPTDPDSDDDGYDDYYEVKRGTDPNDPNSTPFPLWTIAPITLGSSLILGIAGYFTIKNIYLKKRRAI